MTVSAPGDFSGPDVRARDVAVVTILQLNLTMQLRNIRNAPILVTLIPCYSHSHSNSSTGTKLGEI